MGYTIIYRRYRNRVAEMLRGFLFVWICGDCIPIYCLIEVLQSLLEYCGGDWIQIKLEFGTQWWGVVLMIQLSFIFEHMYLRKGEKNRDYERKI